MRQLRRGILRGSLALALAGWAAVGAAERPQVGVPALEQAEAEARAATAALNAHGRPRIANRPLTVSCRASPDERPDGVLVAQGGTTFGYAVYVQKGRLCFSVRNKQVLTTITAPDPAPGKPFSVQASLDDGGAMALHLDGTEVAAGRAGSLITTQPGVGFSIARDTRSPVGPYDAPFAYPGNVTEVTINGVIMATEFYTPKQDMDGLRTEQGQNPDLPDVLLIGDSISIGYTKPTIGLLKGVANVRRAPTNCGDTNRGLQSLGKWLGNTDWDVIHFNWGLHDLCYRHPDSKVQGHRDKVNGTIAVPLQEYATNLEKLVSQLKKTGATLIWAATTVVPEGEAGRAVGDDIRYNAVAEEIMQRHGIAVNNLHDLTTTFGPELFTGPGNVHFTKAGSAKLAEQVAAEIRKALDR